MSTSALEARLLKPAARWSSPFGVRSPVRARRKARAAKAATPTQVDAFLAVYADGTVTLYSARSISAPACAPRCAQMVAEELGIAVDRIKLIEGDTALTPDQGPTAGSTGIMRGGTQIRQAAATARKALIELAPSGSRRPRDLTLADGEVRPKAGGDGDRRSAT